MQTDIVSLTKKGPEDLSEQTLIKTAVLVAAQGAWRWQQRLRRVEYVPTRLRDGRIVWGRPVTVDGKISGGNLRDENHSRGERSPLWSMLSPREAEMLTRFNLRVFDNAA